MNIIRMLLYENGELSLTRTLTIALLTLVGWLVKAIRR